MSKPHELKSLFQTLQNDRPRMIDAHQVKTVGSIRALEIRINTLQEERHLVRRFFNWFRVRKLQSEIKDLLIEHSHYSHELDHTIARVGLLLNSAELAGAEAEFAVIDQLRKLPPSTIVFNDVFLEADRHINFDGVALISAQIDHVVLTPAGVFVIETKRWSQRFVASGEFFNPFDQVSRAGYLCYDLLRQRYGKIRVRSVIASFGDLPAPPSNSYVKVVRPESLANYIAGFQNVELSIAHFNELREFFERRVRG